MCCMIYAFLVAILRTRTMTICWKRLRINSKQKYGFRSKAPTKVLVSDPKIGVIKKLRDGFLMS